MDCDFNLFGEQLPANHGMVGKPQHVATSENRNKVMVLLAAGWTNYRIASALGISQPTLREHYSSELALKRSAMDRVKAARFAMLFEQMKAGSVPAHKEFDRLLTREHLDLGAAKMAKTSPKEKAEGKKAIAKARAPKAHENTDWDGILNADKTVN